MAEPQYKIQLVSVEQPGKIWIDSVVDPYSDADQAIARASQYDPSQRTRVVARVPGQPDEVVWASLS